MGEEVEEGVGGAGGGEGMGRGCLRAISVTLLNKMVFTRRAISATFYTRLDFFFFFLPSTSTPDDPPAPLPRRQPRCR